MNGDFEKKSKKIWMGSFIILVSLLTLTMIFLSSNFTGNAVFKIPSVYDPGDGDDHDIALPDPANPVNPIDPITNTTNNTYTYNYTYNHSYNGSRALVNPDMAIGEMCLSLGYTSPHINEFASISLGAYPESGDTVSNIKITCVGDRGGKECCWSDKITICWDDGMSQGYIA